MNIVYFPDGRPVPFLLSEADLIKFLRLDEIDVRFPGATIRRYREAGLLRGTQISKRVLFRLPDVLDFLEKQGEAVQR